MTKKMGIVRACAIARFAVSEPIGAGTSWQVVGPYQDQWPKGARHSIYTDSHASARRIGARWKAVIALRLVGWPQYEADVATSEAQDMGISGTREIFYYARRHRAD